MSDFQIDFIDGTDLGCWVADTTSDFRPVHVGIGVGTSYLLQTLQGPARWSRRDVVERYLGDRVKHSFDICPLYYDPFLTWKAGEGQIVSHHLYTLLTELPHYLADAGYRIPRPKRFTCVNTVRTVLSTLGIATRSSTSRFFYHELLSMSRDPSSGIYLPEDYPDDYTTAYESEPTPTAD